MVAFAPLGVADMTDEADDDTDDATEEQLVGAFGCLHLACSFFFFAEKNSVTRLENFR